MRKYIMQRANAFAIHFRRRKLFLGKAVLGKVHQSWLRGWRRRWCAVQQIFAAQQIYAHPQRVANTLPRNFSAGIRGGDHYTCIYVKRGKI